MDQLNEKTDTWRSSRSNYGRLINYDHFRPRVFHINNLEKKYGIILSLLPLAWSPQPHGQLAADDVVSCGLYDAPEKYMVHLKNIWCT